MIGEIMRISALLESKDVEMQNLGILASFPLTGSEFLFIDRPASLEMARTLIKYRVSFEMDKIVEQATKAADTALNYLKEIYDNTGTNQEVSKNDS